MRILVVDDEPDVRNAIITFLSMDDHVLDAAEGPRQGRDALKMVKYDAVISDFSMGSENGIDFLRSIYDTLPSDTVFVMVTGCEPNMIWQLAEKLKVKDKLAAVYSKGQRMSEITERLERLVAHRRRSIV